VKRDLGNDYSNERIEYIIDQYIHNDKYRYILKRSFIDGWSASRIAQDKQVDMDPKYVSKKISDMAADLYKYL